MPGISLGRGVGCVRSCVISSGTTATSGISTGDGIARGAVTNLRTRLFGPSAVRVGHGLIGSGLARVFNRSVTGTCRSSLTGRCVCARSRASLGPCYTDVALCPFLLRNAGYLNNISGTPGGLRDFYNSFIGLICRVTDGFDNTVTAIRFLRVFSCFTQGR